LSMSNKSSGRSVMMWDRQHKVVPQLTHHHARPAYCPLRVLQDLQTLFIIAFVLDSPTPDTANVAVPDP
jgi:hypothetical protein